MNAGGKRPEVGSPPAAGAGWLERLPLQRRWTYAPIALTAVLGVGASGLVFVQMSDLEAQRQVGTFSEAARDRVQVVQRELAYAMGVVQDIASFFDASHRVSRRQFREFVGPALRRNPGIRALGWVPRVTAEKRQRFLREARKSLPSFRILERDENDRTLEAEPRPVQYPVLYVQPYPQNKALLGQDLAARPDLLAKLEGAAADPGTHLWDTAEFPGSDSDAYEIGAYRPVFKKTPESVASAAQHTPEHLRGFAFGIFRVGAVIEQALQNLSPAGVDMRFFSEDPSPGAAPFYLHSSRARPVPLGPGEVEAAWEERPLFIGRIPVGDRTWIVVCNPIPGYFEPDHWNSRLILGGGLSFTLLACVYLFALIGRAQEVRRLVAQRTLELERINGVLKSEIAERRRAEQTLQILNNTLEYRIARRTAEAERRARDLEQFAYVTSHDLKAPLRGIANLAAWLKEDLGDTLKPETAEQLALLQDRVARMHALVEGLLAYSRIGHTENAILEVDTRALVEKTLDSLAPPDRFRIEIAPGMPRLITDPLQLGQVFANLIGNAIAHHDRDAGTIRISGRSRDGFCEFDVSDDGPGIPPEYHQKVFLMFQTLRVKDFGANTGIGLALVKKLVEEHGGTIVLHSGPGRGTRFRFTWREETPRDQSGADAPGGRETHG